MGGGSGSFFDKVPGSQQSMVVSVAGGRVDGLLPSAATGPGAGGSDA